MIYRVDHVELRCSVASWVVASIWKFFDLMKPQWYWYSWITLTCLNTLIYLNSKYTLIYILNYPQINFSYHLFLRIHFGSIYYYQLIYRFIFIHHFFMSISISIFHINLLFIIILLDLTIGLLLNFLIFFIW